jgi:hypothetical protein
MGFHCRLVLPTSQMPPYMNLHIDENRLADFTSRAMNFIQEFNDSQEHMVVANAIFHLLIDNIYYNINQPDHPFNLYADAGLSMDETVYRIRDHLGNSLVNESNFTRGLVRAFCSPGGVNREALEELLDHYYQFALISTQ